MDSIIGLLQALAGILTPVFLFIVWICPIKIYWLKNGQRGVICTFGSVRTWRMAERGPGISFAGPFEEMVKVQAKGRYLDAEDQELSLNDGRIVGVSVAVFYDILEVRPAVLEVADIDLLIGGTLMDQMRSYATTVSWKELTNSDKLASTLAGKMNRKLGKHGCRVQEVLLTDWRIDGTQMICDVVREALSRCEKIVLGGVI